MGGPAGVKLCCLLMVLSATLPDIAEVIIYWYNGDMKNDMLHVCRPLPRVTTLATCASLLKSAPRPAELAHPGFILHRADFKSFNRAAKPPIAASGAANEEAPLTCAPPRIGKRKVALFVGYEGTAYRGLQVQPTTAPEETIEDALKAAIFAAGGILPSNYGDISKLAWSRSSRTDKRVHSLSTVVSMKLECDSDAFNTDPDGIALAEGINAHLPPAIRVFSVQRVSKKFDARRECIRREYSYFLPTSLLGLQGDDSPADTEKLRLLRAAWEGFAGSRAFHNYTKRRLYRDQKAGKRGGRTGHRDIPFVPTQDSEEDDSESEDDGKEAVAAHASGVEDAPDAVASEEEREPFKMHLEWRGERRENDAIGQRHFRFIELCVVGPAPMTLVPGGPQCIELTVRGGSFMLHQIRHMVGAAVAVALGIFPPELLEASLSVPARINLPLAPPSTLVLTGAEFAPFRTSWDGKSAAVSQWTGERLDLREPGQLMQLRFAQEALLPAVSELLAGEEWAVWEGQLRRVWYEESELQELLKLHGAWCEENARKKDAKLQAALLEAAAAANVGDAS